MSELPERTFHSENDKRRFTLSFSPDRLFFTISWRNNRGINASHFNILRDEAISVAEDILDRYKPAKSAPPASLPDAGQTVATDARELTERFDTILMDWLNDHPRLCQRASVEDLFSLRDALARASSAEAGIKLKWAPRGDGDGGWTLDYGYLNLIAETMNQEYRPSLEEIEAVILAHEARAAIDQSEAGK